METNRDAIHKKEVYFVRMSPYSILVRYVQWLIGGCVCDGGGGEAGDYIAACCNRVYGKRWMTLYFEFRETNLEMYIQASYPSQSANVLPCHPICSFSLIPPPPLIRQHPLLFLSSFCTFLYLSLTDNRHHNSSFILPQRFYPIKINDKVFLVYSSRILRWWPWIGDELQYQAPNLTSLTVAHLYSDKGDVGDKFFFHLYKKLCLKIPFCNLCTLQHLTTLVYIPLL